MQFQRFSWFKATSCFSLESLSALGPPLILRYAPRSTTALNETHLSGSPCYLISCWIIFHFLLVISQTSLSRCLSKHGCLHQEGCVCYLEAEVCFIFTVTLLGIILLERTWLREKLEFSLRLHICCSTGVSSQMCIQSLFLFATLCQYFETIMKCKSHMSHLAQTKQGIPRMSFIFSLWLSVTKTLNCTSY